MLEIQKYKTHKKYTFNYSGIIAEGFVMAIEKQKEQNGSGSVRITEFFPPLKSGIEALNNIQTKRLQSPPDDDSWSHNIVFKFSYISGIVPILLQNIWIRRIYWLKCLPIQVKAPLVTTRCWRIAKSKKKKKSFRSHHLSNKQTQNKHVSLCVLCWPINGCPYI